MARSNFSFLISDNMFQKDFGPFDWSYVSIVDTCPCPSTSALVYDRIKNEIRADGYADRRASMSGSARTTSPILSVLTIRIFSNCGSATIAVCVQETNTLATSIRSEG